MRRRLLAIVIALSAALGSVVAVATPAQAALPDLFEGRRYFTLALQVAQTNAGNGDTRGFTRLSHLAFNPSGTVEGRYWSNSFAQVPAAGQSWINGGFAQSPWRPAESCKQGSRDLNFRASVGFNLPPKNQTTGLTTCDVRMPWGFHADPPTRYGTDSTYTSPLGDMLEITWTTTGVKERHLDFTDPDKPYSELRLASHTHANATNAIGFMFGSTTAPAAPLSMAPWVANNVTLSPFESAGSTAGGLWDAQNMMHWSRQWGQAGITPAGTALNFSKYTSTAHAKCIRNQKHLRSDPNGQHGYWCTQGADRKVVWHNMKNDWVSLWNGLCTGETTDCATSTVRGAAVDYSMPLEAGGHMIQVLQLVDDTGTLRGILGTEASLYSKSAASAYLAVFAGVKTN